MGETNDCCRPASLEDLETLIESLNRQHVDESPRVSGAIQIDTSWSEH